MKIDPNAPAYPAYTDKPTSGLTIRAEFAKHLLAASIAEGGWAAKGYARKLADEALVHADALIAALNAEPKP